MRRKDRSGRSGWAISAVFPDGTLYYLVEHEGFVSWSPNRTYWNTYPKVYRFKAWARYKAQKKEREWAKYRYRHMGA